jgi:hypothetical protein
LILKNINQTLLKKYFPVLSKIFVIGNAGNAPADIVRVKLSRFTLPEESAPNLV